MVITSGTKWGIVWAVAMMAMSSLVWLDWWGPGVRIARFLWSLFQNQTPPPLLVFCLPLWKQAPLVYISIFWWCQFGPSVTWRCAGFFDSFSGSAKTWKQSARLFLQVSVGSNKISPLFSFMIVFWYFLFGVSDRFPCLLSLESGFNLGKIRFRWVSASVAHSCGVQQWLFWSSLQS